MTIEQFFGTLQQSVVGTWRKHLKTDKYSAHKALDEYYNDMPELVDTLIEDYMGINGKVKDYENTLKEKEYNTIEYLNKMRELVKTGRKEFCDGESELESDCDAILSLIDKTLYQLKELKENTGIKPLAMFINEAMNGGQFAEEKLNGFSWKKNANYVLRYNTREKRYELFEDTVNRGMGRIPMLVIKSNDPEVGIDIVRQLQNKYAKGNRQLSYSGTIYGF
jgi:hypothetical protein